MVTGVKAQIMPFLLFFIVAGWIACTVYTSIIAESKGHDGISWGFGALLFGPIVFIASVGLSDKKTYRLLREIAVTQGVKPRRLIISGELDYAKVIKSTKGVDKDSYVLDLLARKTPGLGQKLSRENSSIEGAKAIFRDAENRILYAYVDVSIPTDVESMWVPEEQ
jgi:hypothetical protein